MRKILTMVVLMCNAIIRLAYRLSTSTKGFKMIWGDYPTHPYMLLLTSNHPITKKTKEDIEAVLGGKAHARHYPKKEVE
jgi:hypothetical protein